MSDGELLKLPMTVNAADFSLVNERTHPGVGVPLAGMLSEGRDGGSL